MQKLLILFSFIVLYNTNADAQLFKSVLSGGNNISNAVAVIAENFQNNFYNVQGEELPAEEGRDVFSSNVKIPGSMYSIIYRFHSKEDSTAAFESLLYEGESYKDALKAYKQAFRQLKGMKFNSTFGKLSFDGKMEEPSDVLKFTSSNLYTDADSKPYKYFMAQIEILQSIEGWKVKLNLHSRKDDSKRY
ncbi:MAG TPA: hypothetical protein PK504_10320 [Ferruginibacter sp.]|nr:hypothetical protein [Ferruginibacter sp.]HRE64750.1 hypothetical protein [Ferruginibacter sp.]